MIRKKLEKEIIKSINTTVDEYQTLDAIIIAQNIIKDLDVVKKLSTKKIKLWPINWI